MLDVSALAQGTAAEVGSLLGPGSPVGTSVTVDELTEHVFGVFCSTTGPGTGDHRGSSVGRAAVNII